MKAAVVRTFDAPPRYEDFDLPPATDEDAVVVDVVAAADGRPGSPDQAMTRRVIA